MIPRRSPVSFAPSFAIPLTLLLALPLSGQLACAGRTVLMDGRAVPYAEAEGMAFANARDASAAGRYEESAALYAAFLRDFPDSALCDEARFRRGQMLSRAGKHTEAQGALSELLEQHPGSAFKRGAALELSLSQAKTGQRENAAQLLELAAAGMSAQEQQDSASSISEAFAQSGQHGESARWGAKALERSAPGAERDAQLSAFTASIEKAPASDLARLVSELDVKSPAYAPAALRLAKIQLHIGDRLHAQELLTQALAQAPTGPQADGARQLLLRLQGTLTVRPSIIGVVLPLTGDLKPYADTTLDAIALRLDVSGKGPVQVVVKDSKNDPDGAMRAVEELAREGAIAILGPIGLAEGPAAAVRAQQLGVPMISLSRAEGITSFGPYVFRNMLTNSALARAVADYAQKKLLAKSFGILQPDSPYGDELGRYFWDALDAGGAAVRAFERYPRQTTTFKPFVSRMVGRANLGERADYSDEERRIFNELKDPYKRRKALQALRNSAAPLVDFDALFIPDNAKTVRLIAPALAAEDLVTNGCDEKELAVQRKTMKRDDLHTVQLLGTNLWDSADLVSEQSGAARYVQCSVFADSFFPGSQRPATHAFVEEYDSVYHRQPGFLDAHAYDAAGLLKELIQKKHPATREQLRELLATLDKPFTGSTGELTFGPDREVQKSLFWLWITRGNIQEFDPEGTPPVPTAHAPETAAPAQP